MVSGAPASEIDQPPYAPEQNIMSAGLPDAMGPAPRQVPKVFNWLGQENLATEFDMAMLMRIGMRVVQEYQIDVKSRSDWKTKAEKAMKLALQKAEPKTYPWAGASNIIWPLITSASNEFAARAYPAIIQNKNIVKGSLVGDDAGIPLIVNGKVQNGPAGQPFWIKLPGSKQTLADKIASHMSWQFLSEMPNWEQETDQMLHAMPIIGCAARKGYYDPVLQRNCFHYVSMLKLVVNYNARSFDTVPRITEEFELYPNEIRERIASQTFIPFNFGRAPSKQGYEDDPDAPHDFLEQHRWWDLDDDGYAEPYVVTVHKETNRVVRIVPRFDETDITLGPDGKILRIEAQRYYTLYQFLPNPESAVYGLGFGHLLGPINEAINTTLNQMFDAGHLENTGAGFIAAGLSINTGAVKFKIGQFNPVNTMGMPLRDAVYQIPFKGPNPVLFSLLGALMEAGKEVAGLKDVLSGDQNPQSTAPTTMLAMIEQGLRVFSDIYKRIYRAMTSEYSLAYDLNGKYLAPKSGYQKGAEWVDVTRQDYQRGSGVEPIGDPSMVTDMQKMGRAAFLLGFAQDPDCNPIEIKRRAFQAAGIEQIDKILVEQRQPDPLMVATLKKTEAETLRLLAQEASEWAKGILSMAQARALADEKEMHAIDASLKQMNLHLESVYAQIAAINAQTQVKKVENDRAKLASANRK